MKQGQTGVSLIELIVVIIIMIVVAGAAMPRKLSLASVASAAEAAMTVNYAGCATTHHRVVEKTCVRVTACSQAALLMHGGVPPGHSVEGQTGQNNGDALACRIVSPDGTTSMFAGLAAGI